MEPFCKEQYQILCKPDVFQKDVLYLVQASQLGVPWLSPVFFTLFAYYFFKGKEGGSINVVTLPVITQPRGAGKKPSGCFLHLGIYQVVSCADRTRCRVEFSVHLSPCVRRRSKSHKDTIVQGLGLFGSAHFGLIPAISFFLMVFRSFFEQTFCFYKCSRERVSLRDFKAKQELSLECLFHFYSTNDHQQQ